MRILLTTASSRHVSARGTRETGKTTLAELLASYYQGRGEQVILATGWKEVTDPIQYLVDLGNHQGCQEMDYSSFTDSNVVVILDQAHHSYPDLTLWLGFIKTQSGRSNGPRICLFSLFGSPTTGRTVYPEGTSPVCFTPEQRVDLATTEPYLYFARAEDYVFDITMGHPAAVQSFVRFLYDFYRSVIELDKSKIVTTDMIVNATWNDEKSLPNAAPMSRLRNIPKPMDINVKGSNST
ncbi:ATP-binding protein [Aspergillus glaucus CBS 516.65]|uniref:AAA domain-containing protein n=1 Tax=Aspergillus glaucus CBS 516.65 TaxID=1160497 RepID=A0A1L9VKV5_ASPGL|nr:hypothetical protein ASPGLDRAFT_35012 [Aspergillus glaucus CBS 516.65]OJJ84510.1 hypothetical protein ASPGLDRAFT_35012 [Aspergillus glaucus CBS 516.65]